MKSGSIRGVVVVVLYALTPVYAQRGEGYGTGPQLVTVGGGPGNIEQQVASLDFAQITLARENRKREALEQERQAQGALVDSGTISALDLSAPGKAVREYNDGVNLLRSQHSTEAI